MAGRRGPGAWLTAAFAVVAHLVLLVAPLTCACAAPAPTEGAAKACCCKPGDAPMPCSQRGPAGAQSHGEGGSCASSHASCSAVVPDAVSAPAAADLATAPAPAVLPLLPVLAAPAPVERAMALDTGPRGRPIGLVLARCTVLLI